MIDELAKIGLAAIGVFAIAIVALLVLALIFGILSIPFRILAAVIEASSHLRTLPRSLRG